MAGILTSVSSSANRATATIGTVVWTRREGLDSTRCVANLAHLGPRSDPGVGKLRHC